MSLEIISALLLFWPLLSGIFLLFIKGEAAKKAALGSALITLALGVVAVCSFVPGPTTQFMIKLPWIYDAGIYFNVGMDGLSLLMVLLTVFLVPLIILSSFGHTYKNPNAFYALILFMQCGLIGVFISLDAFLFYFFWELALVPIYFISAIWGGERRIPITFKFFVYTIFGSLLMLVAFIYLYISTPGGHGADINSFYSLRLDNATQGWIFWGLFIAFAIKIPIFPFHTWQPDTYTESPAPATMLLSGIMLKMGIYGLIRWLLPMVPEAVEEWGNLAMILAIAGIVYASIIAIRQKDIKRLVAYSSIAHVGLIAAGVFAAAQTLNPQGMQGAVVQMLAHGINVVGMFFIIDIVERRTGNRDINKLGGIVSEAPVFAVYFMIILLGSVALPLTNGFIGEFLLLLGIYQYSAWMSAVAGLTIIFGAVYMLRMYQKVMLGLKTTERGIFADLSLSEKAVLFPLAALVLLMGIYPSPILKMAEPAINNILTIISR
jgi:NADH-quinone oxidoreductase subunit M